MSKTPARLDVRKTYKLYLGGAFPRSESGRSYPVHSSSGELLAHAAQASRKDVRDAVRAARGAFPKWSAATAYNRGQVLYRVAEMLEGRAAEFAAHVPAAEVDAAIDRWVYYAGWADKYAQVVGSTNPVAGPYFTFSLPEPTGVVGVARAAGVAAARPGLGARPGADDRQHGRGRGVGGAAARRRPARRGARDVRRARPAWSTS